MLAEAAAQNREGPSIKLLNWFAQPYNNAVATARTCYSSRVIYPEEVAENEDRRKQRDSIAASIYKAGHHTTLQHASFQFVMERVSRQFIWSFLHAHPFYNSEQVSQRYVEVKAGNYFIPVMPAKAQTEYLRIIEMQMKAYQDLIVHLNAPTTAQYLKIFPSRKLEEKRWQTAIKKRAMEVARYVLPLATHAHLYHTISGITLHRYHRLCEQYDVPLETRAVVKAMVQEVERIDPEFMLTLEDPLPLEETLEFQLLQKYQSAGKSRENTARFLDEFDASLGDKTSVLVGVDANAQSTMAQAVRSMLGLPKDQLPDSAAIAAVLDPAQNPYLSESLNLVTMAKLTRALHHVHLTFRKKISHTADSQDQRHRMTPGSRPILHTHFLADRADYITPVLFRESSHAEALYHQNMEEIWRGISRVIDAGAALEAALYLLPNAFPIRFEESGDLAAFHHKWTTRLCYTAQEEIWANCRDEVLQVKARFPEIGRWMQPPCTLRNWAGVTPYCPEGERFCGVRVWKLDVEDFNRLL